MHDCKQSNIDSGATPIGSAAAHPNKKAKLRATPNPSKSQEILTCSWRGAGRSWRDDVPPASLAVKGDTEGGASIAEVIFGSSTRFSTMGGVSRVGTSS